VTRSAPETVDAVRFAAIDLGASSGRVMALDLLPDGLRLEEVHRFPNGPVQLGERLHWDILSIYRHLLDGLQAVGPVASVGIDGWAVDYGLLDDEGALLGNPYHYRDSRTGAAVCRVDGMVGPDERYRITGVQVQPFNTIYQLMARPGQAQLAAARGLLLIPDLLNYWLTGRQAAELTNASTTGLLDIRNRVWATDLMRVLGLAPTLLPPLVRPGTVLGPIRPSAGVLPGVPVVAVGSHDTASAVAAVPARDDDFAFISAGTWSLVGFELAAPVLSVDSRQANFTNELGIDGTVRYLRNVMGLWLLQECLREWPDEALVELLAAAGREPGLQQVVDAADPAFLPPGRMTDRLAEACIRTGQQPPQTRPGFVRCILDSLALAHARAVRVGAALCGKRVKTVHLVGGGAQNALLCQLTADACGLPVVAGPVEAAAYGNALVQARAGGFLTGGLAVLRRDVIGSVKLQRYEPRGDYEGWRDRELRLFGTSRAAAAGR
jgi:rhamnulokinase